jgi:hypothetical protein
VTDLLNLADGMGLDPPLSGSSPTAPWRPPCAVKRWPAGQGLTDPVTGDELTVERERGFLILAISDADTGQVPMVTRYLLGWLAAPNPPPPFRHTGPAGEPSPVRMSLNQAGALLAFNEQTGAMQATAADLVELRERLDRTIAAAVPVDGPGR